LNKAATIIQKVQRGHQARRKTSERLNCIPHIIHIDLKVTLLFFPLL
jgi:hypothetical protein